MSEIMKFVRKSLRNADWNDIIDISDKTGIAINTIYAWKKGKTTKAWITNIEIYLSFLGYEITLEE